MTDEIPPDTGSADPGSELRAAANAVRQRYKPGSPAYGFWRVIAGIWERWADRVESEIELSAMSKAEFQAALFSARRYMEMREGGDEWVVAAGPLSCATCGHVFIAKGDENVPATELSGRLLAHVCGGPPAASGDQASGDQASGDQASGDQASGDQDEQ